MILVAGVEVPSLFGRTSDGTHRWRRESQSILSVALAPPLVYLVGFLRVSKLLTESVLERTDDGKRRLREVCGQL